MYPGQQQGGGYPPQGGGYPPQQGGGMPGYPPQQQGMPGGGGPGAIGFNTGGGGGYPPQQQGGYPPASNTGYPPQQQGGYPPQQPSTGYPPQPAYPPQHGGGYPSQPQVPSYPPQQNSGYPAQPAQPGYPPQQHQQQQQQQGGYPPQQSYPQQQQQQQQQQAPRYPAQAPGGYPQQPPQQQPQYGQGGQAGYPGGQQPGATGGGSQGQANQAIGNMNRGQGTVKAWPNFNATADCEAIKKAMKGFGCDSKGVLNIVCQRSAAQRQEIRRLFKTMYGKDLIKELIDELKGKLEDVIVALMSTPAEYDARSLRYAMDGIGTNESILVEVLASRTNAEILAIRAAYKFLYGRDLERDVEGETSYHFKRLCVSLLQGGRDESGRTDAVRANQDATRLYQAGEKKIGTDESTFNAVVCAQNFNQLRLVFQEYQKVSGHDLEKAIKSEFSGDVEDGLLAVVKVARNAPAFFAERLYLSMKGMGTKDHQLIRGVVSRAEVDMVQIKVEFQKTYGKTLESFIAGDTSGAYKEALLTLVRGN